MKPDAVSVRPGIWSAETRRFGANWRVLCMLIARPETEPPPTSMSAQRLPVQLSSGNRWHCLKLVALVLLFAITGNAAAAKVYKWVDQDGNVHFGDRPTDSDAQELELKSHQPAVPAPQPLPDTRNRATISEVMEEERLRRKEAREKENQARQSRQRKCLLARDNLRSMEESGYLYDIDSSGKRRILSDAQRKASEQRAREVVTRFCG